MASKGYKQYKQPQSFMALRQRTIFLYIFVAYAWYGILSKPWQMTSVTSDTSDTSGKHVTLIHNSETQILTRNLHGLRKTGRIPCRSMYFTYNLLTTPWVREHFHSRKHPGIMLCISLWWRCPERKSFYFNVFVFVRLYGLLVHLVVGVQEAFRMANTIL